MRATLSCLVICLSASIVPFTASAQTKNEQKKLMPYMALPVALSYVKDTGMFVIRPGSVTPEDWGSSKYAADIAISPDAMSLAITLRSPKTGSKSLFPARNIAVIDSKGAEPKVLESIPGNNSYGPIWSPDGKQLLVCCSTDGKWNVGVVNRDGSGFRILATPFTKDPIIYPAFWGKDGGTVYVSDSSSLYQIGLDGSVLKRMPFSDWSITLTSTGGKMALSPDGNKFLLETEVDTHEKGDPLSSSAVVYVCDMVTKSAVKLTSHNGEISKPSWLPDEKSILFSASRKNEVGIYRKDLGTGAETLVVRGATAPSLSAVPQP